MASRILVLDDDPGVLEVLDLSLTYSGFQVRPLLSGDNIFRMVKNFEPHLIILDYILRGPDGGELCKQLKKDPDTREIPVIMLSGHPKANETVGKGGCDSFIAKPFDLTKLVDEINHFIQPPALALP